MLCRASLLDALQKLGMRWRRQRQLWACSLILETKGHDLTRLKSMVDDGGDYHVMYKLVYNDLQVSVPWMTVTRVQLQTAGGSV